MEQLETGKTLLSRCLDIREGHQQVKRAELADESRLVQRPNDLWRLSIKYAEDSIPSCPSANLIDYSS